MNFGHGMLEHFALDPAVTYLNHGTVGVAPRRVLLAQQRIRDEMERQPCRFLARELVQLVGVPTDRPGRMRQAAAAVAEFVGARPDDLVFVDNASTGVNAVLRSLPFRVGDEILLTDQTYGAVAYAAGFVARGCGAVVCTVAVPYPAFEPGLLVERVAAALTPKTRLVVLDHIVSETALILPVAEMAARCRERGVRVLVDGAHAPGMIPLDIPALGVDYYTANLHKWAYAPKGCGLLWAAPERQAELHPPVISWGLDQGFTHEFDWVGTRDPSPWLAAPEGIAFLRELGPERVRAYTHGLAWDGARELTARFGTRLAIGEAAVGSMVTLPLPESLGKGREEVARLRDALLFEDGIEVQMHAGHGRLWARLCAQVYTERKDLDRLGEAIARRAS
jgi:isopenicillin-N epimerase